ncbi:LTA synthase family protein [Gorillibacterium timonense]|uniref:LTA synthase family protein n=1 Tax=Gorillibacterium timonense TaxID=1689269 RepID=UPI00071C726F|nr:LTA synthase family protein [Gorillibacterium timonense]
MQREASKPFYTTPFFVFTILMIFKIYLSWFVIFGASVEALPLVTAIFSIWVLFCLIERFSDKRKMVCYMIVNIVLTSIYFAAIMYYKYYGVIVTYRALQQANQVTQVKGSVFHLMHPYFLLIYVDIVVMLLLQAFSRKFRTWGRAKARYRTWISLGFIVSLVFSFGAVWFNRDIVNEVKQAQHMGILNYEVYTIASDLFKGSDKPVQVTPEMVKALKGENALDPTQPAQFKGLAKGRNVIVIQLEAFQDILIGKSIDGIELTPNMNKLAKENVYFKNFFQQAGQGNTSDAEYLLNTSLFVPPNGAAAQTYVDKALPSLPKLFKTEGYDAVTFHTNDVEFWNRKELYAALGFDRHYDKTFFKDEDFLFFGASDPVLYRKTAEEMGRLQKEGTKFYANVISMSSHHPFDLPEERRLIKLPDKYQGTFVNDYITAENYADHALGQFIEELKANGVWDNSLIVIYGDHMGMPVYSLTDHEKDLLKEYLGREYNYQDMLNIPLIISVPGKLEARTYSHVGGQIDLLPTIANLMDLSLKNQVVFGQDILNNRNDLLPERYYLPSGSFITNKAIFVPGKGYEDGETYPLPEGEEPQGGPNETTKDEYDRALQLIKLCDDYVKTLPERY